MITKMTMMLKKKSLTRMMMRTWMMTMNDLHSYKKMSCVLYKTSRATSTYDDEQEQEEPGTDIGE